MRNIKLIAFVATLTLLCFSAQAQEITSAKPIPNMALFASDKASLGISDHLYTFDDFTTYEVTGTAAKIETIAKKTGGAEIAFNCENLQPATLQG